MENTEAIKLRDRYKEREELLGAVLFRGEINAKLFVDFIHTIEPVHEEVGLSVTDESMSIVTVDSAYVMLANSELKMEAFDAYERAVDDGTIVLPISLRRLSEVLSLATRDDQLLIEILDTPEKEKTKKSQKPKPYSVVLLFNNARFVLRAMSPSYIRKPQSMIEVEGLVAITVKDKALKKAVKASSEVNDIVSITYDPKEEILTFRAESDNGTDSMRVKYTKEHPEVIEKEIITETNKPVYSMFSLLLLSDAIKSSTDTVKFILGENLPLKMEYDFADSFGHVFYIIAPRVEQ